MPEKVNPVKYFLCGGFGGICTVLTGHPLDTIKVRLQTMPTPGPGEEPLYKGTFDCASRTIKNEGFKGLYKGMSAPLVAVAPIFALSFFGFGLGKRLQQSNEAAKLTYKQLFIAGGFSGIWTTFLMAPGERIKCLLQIQQGTDGPKKYDGMIDCAKKLYKEGGIKSIYKGSVATAARDVPGGAMYFLAYEFVQNTFKARSPGGEVGFMTTLFAGGSAGMAYWILGMPPDVIKSRLQTAPEGSNAGMVEVFKELMKKEGPVALYKGLTPVMIRAFPANAACFVGFEMFSKFLNKVAPGF